MEENKTKNESGKTMIHITNEMWSALNGLKVPGSKSFEKVIWNLIEENGDLKKELDKLNKNK